VGLTSSAASSQTTQDIARLDGAQIVVLGEVHDNPAHHLVQAGFVEGLSPSALVFEMLTPEQAARIGEDTPRDAASLETALDWDASGWPAFSMYYPIFAAAPDAALFGAGVTRDAARAALDDGLAVAFGEDANIFGLAAPLPASQQTEREALQAAAHCDALPAALLPGMVDIQRLRDATLARTALAALDQTGGPVVVITGNGHARADWGVPALIATARPEVTVKAVLQGEGDARPDGGGDIVLPGPVVERGDPCAAFAK
jgi:uncharacterized iron-regulated protein